MTSVWAGAQSRLLDIGMHSLASSMTVLDFTGRPAIRGRPEMRPAHTGDAMSTQVARLTAAVDTSRKTLCAEIDSLLRGATDK